MVTSFLDVNMSDFDLYILKKYIFIHLLVLCIPILWGTALQCIGIRKNTLLFMTLGLQQPITHEDTAFLMTLGLLQQPTTHLPPPPPSEQNNTDYLPFLFFLPKSFCSVFNRFSIILIFYFLYTYPFNLSFCLCIPPPPLPS